MKKIVILLVLLAMATFLAWADDHNKAENTAPKNSDKVEKKAEKQEFITTESGLRYKDLVVGKGKKAENGDKVEMHYTLWLDVDGNKGAKIQSSKDTDEPFPFEVGQRGLIAGWNEGCLGMQVGGVRQLMIPSELGWGKRGMGGMIPPDQNVIFELEFVKYAEKKEK